MSTLIVPFLWYAIGRWIDQDAARPPSEMRFRFPLRILTQSLLRITALFFLFASVAGILPTYHHRTGASNFCFGTVAAWCVVYLAVSFWSTRRERSRLLNATRISAQK